jgi:hypothetical protein
MMQRIARLIQSERKGVVRIAAVLLVAFSVGGYFASTFAQEQGPRTFASPEDAGSALFAAMQADGEQSAAPLNILGPAGKDILSSGDPQEDADARTGFIVKYKEMHRFVKEPNGTVTLVIGAENWPLPIPLVNKNGSWFFDTAAGKDEILFRRIGKNELAAVEACHELVEGQKLYFARPQAKIPKQFALRLVSDEGRHNGLYWHGAYNEFDSPIDPLIAYADGNDTRGQVGDPVPYNGYFFRILTKQGPHATGGAKNYIVNGAMTEGFAFVAYPAEYRSSGVMTFIVDESGVIYEKDLGPDTAKSAKAMSTFDPDSTWHKTE